MHQPILKNHNRSAQIFSNIKPEDKMAKHTHTQRFYEPEVKITYKSTINYEKLKHQWNKIKTRR